MDFSRYKENYEELLRSSIELLPSIKPYHSPYSEIYKYISRVAEISVDNLFASEKSQKINLGILGTLNIPFYSMGAINTTHLFGLDELILFSFYAKNKNNYEKVADLGANVGLHSIIMSNLGFHVTSYEPDQIHFQKIKEHIKLNCVNLKPNLVNKAISANYGTVDFIRVVGNTTGSHIKGSKNEPYGKLETIKVETDSFKEIIKNFDFLKIDIEGHEAQVLTTTSKDDWLNTDAMVEVGSESNAKVIFEFLKLIGVNCFSQKTGWNIVKDLKDMPNTYKEGSLFISCKDLVPW